MSCYTSFPYTFFDGIEGVRPVAPGATVPEASVVLIDGITTLTVAINLMTAYDNFPQFRACLTSGKVSSQVIDCFLHCSLRCVLITATVFGCIYSHASLAIVNVGDVKKLFLEFKAPRS